MTILAFGKTGQVGRELGRLAGVTCLGRDRADLSDPAACAAVIRAMRPRAVINAAAWTDVDGAEAEQARARTINAEAPAAMAAQCAALGIPFVTISTDYVFDGSGETPWRPDDTPAPINAYGRTKLAGERAVAGAGGAWAVLRTSWVFSPHGRNFVTTMLQLGRSRGALDVVADQVGGPTPADAIARACLNIAEMLCTEPEKSGIYHFSGSPDIDWAGFAREIFAQAGLGCTVRDIATDEWPTPAARPRNSRLDCSRTGTVFDLKRPDWRASLHEILNEPGGAEDA